MLDKKMRTIFKIIITIICLFCVVSFYPNNPVNADGWIGSGSTSGGGGSGGGGSGGCNSSYTIDCAGASWIFYKATSTTTSSTSFPYYGFSINASIPASCSNDTSGGGFWHYGVNNFGVILGGGPFDWDYGAFYGHWKTLNWGYDPGWGEGALHNNHYRTGNNSNLNQKVGVYKASKYGSEADVLSAYKEAYQAVNGTAWTHSYLPDDVYAFCWSPNMSEVTLTLKAVDTNGTSMSSKISDKTATGAPNTDHTVTAADAPSGYIFKGIKSTSTASSYLSTNKTYTEKISANTTRYAVYEQIAFEASAAAVGNGADISTGWQKVNTFKEQSVDCSDPEGCTVTFELKLRRSGGDQNTKYYLHKGTGRYDMTSFEGPLTGNTVTRTFDETILPGKTVCYAIQFSPTGKDENIETYEKVCVTAVDKNSKFEASTSASTPSGDVNVSTGWQSTSTYKSATFTCNTSSGCRVDFTLKLKRTKGSGTTSYSFERGTSRNSMYTLPGTESTGPSSASLSKTYTAYIKPNQTVCYDIKFSPTGSSSNNAWEKVCVSAVQTPSTPDCPGSGFLDMFIKNESVANSWTKQEYAKPGDKLTYCAYYNPSDYQGTRGYNFTSYNCAGSCTNFKQPLGNALNLSNSIQIRQNILRNSETIGLGNFGGSALSSKSYQAGSTDYHTEFNSYNVTISNTGDVIDEQTRTTGNTPTSTAWTTQTSNPRSYNTCGHDPYDCDPYDCNCSTCCDDEGKNCSKCNCDTCYHTCYEHYEVGHISTSTAYSPIAHGHVPYNFTNSTSITTPTSTIVYAGERKTLSLDLTVNPKWNSVTNGYYATQVHNAKWKLRIWYNGTYYDTYETSGENLNLTDTNGSTVSRQKDIIIPDVEAGTQICVQSLIYPATSGEDTNWNKQSGDGKWAESSKACFTVAKRPSIQIWGGNIYSNGNIETTTSGKFHVAGVTTYHPDLAYYSSGGYIFGSWGDQGVIANGKVKGLASGAALGYNLGNKESYSHTLYISSGFCNRVPLSFANYLCGDSVGSLNKSSSSSDLTIDKSTLISKFIFGTASGGSKTITSFLSSANQTGNVAYRSATNITLSPNNSVPKNIIQVIHAKNVTITKDILYDSSSEYTNFSVMPKLLIYGEDSVNINCSVNRIDAIIVSTKVTTCSDGDGTTDTSAVISNAANYKQLIINGAVIANQLIANRAYGAATGANSIVAAEIINFDPSLYRWDLSSGNTSSSGVNANTDLTTTYQKELAPRY